MTTEHTKKIGQGMLLISMVLAMALMTWLFGTWEDYQRNPNQSPQSNQAQNYIEVILQRNRMGHYVTSGTVNDQMVEFLLDTGATDVVIGADLADELGLVRGRRALAKTANGTIVVYSTVIREMSIGRIGLVNVKASINPSMDSHAILFGMSALGELELFQREDQMRLRQYF